MITRNHTSALEAHFNREVAAHVRKEEQQQQDRAEGHRKMQMSNSLAPLVTALTELARATSKVSQQSQKALRVALVSMDSMIPGPSDDIDAQLQEATAAVIAVSDATSHFLRDVCASMETAQAAKIETAREHGDTDGSSATTPSLSQSILHCAKIASAKLDTMLVGRASSVSRPAPTWYPIDALQHFKAAAEILVERLVREKLALGLCEEELQLYSRDMLVLGRCGVLAVVPASATVERLAAAYACPKPASGSSHVQRSEIAVAAAAAEPAGRMSATSSAARAVMGQLSRVTGAASARVADTARAVATRTAGVHKDPQGGAFKYQHKYQYDSDEVRQLMVEGAQLEQQLVESSAKAALEVEASVRELSLLTSLLSEKSLLQAEQLNLVAKNTDDAHDSVLKARSQLQSALRAPFWNATRQLIFVLWVSTIGLWIAHVVIR